MSDTWINLLAIDPALRNFGLAKLRVHTETFDVEVLDLKLIETTSEAGKTVRRNSDDLRRATESYVASLEMAKDCDLIAAEVPSGAQSARAALSFGVAVGLLAALGQFRPLIQVMPTEVKKCITGRRTASKDELIQWASTKFPQAKWLTAKTKGVVRLVDKNEHLADACAIGVTATGTVEFKAAVKMMQSMQSIRLAA